MLDSDASISISFLQVSDGEGRSYLGVFLTSRKVTIDRLCRATESALRLDKVFANVETAATTYGKIHFMVDGKKKLESCGWEVTLPCNYPL